MAEPRPALEVTPLQTRLAQLIRTQGPISVADFMADALSHPQYGYYMTNTPFGREGDFTTAPEISQVFGELIGAWLVKTWMDMGEPSIFQLIELGPGRGVLMADILRTARIRPAFLRAARITLIEMSGRLRHEQKSRLEKFDANITWASKLSEAPPGPTLLIANEFVDCLPIRQFVRTNAGWFERMVGLAEIAGAEELVFELSKTPLRADHLLPRHIRDAAPGSVFETCAPAGGLMDDIAARLAPYKGRALILDYGHARSGLGDTLQAVRDHAYWPPLAAPGKADLTAHVDFEALAVAALRAGSIVYGPVAQGAFLRRLGLDARVDALCESTSLERDRLEIRSGAERLVAEDQMGQLIKALCLSSAGLGAPAGFEAA